MKTALVYVSYHHENTRKLVTAIAQANALTVIDARQSPEADLSGYDRIGFASGIAFGRFYREMNEFVARNLPDGKSVFFLYTCGRASRDFSRDLQAVAKAKRCTVLGSYGCLGYDTYGPFRLIGGLNRNHPDAAERQGAVDFYQNL